MSAEFTDPRLAAVYDALDPDRSDLEPYLAAVERHGARRVLDVGCGTGVFALALAQRGVEVVGVDPARASLDVARRKPGADRVTWLEGDASLAAAHGPFDLATMTANVAMVFLTDEDAAAALAAIAQALRPGGALVFESRRPDAEAWRTWTRETTWSEATVDAQRVASWVEVRDARLPFVDFCNVFVFDDGEPIVADSTLRWRELDEWRDLLEAAGFRVTDVAEAPDRPGREWIVSARKR